jgi:hypothetical protein
LNKHANKIRQSEPLWMLGVRAPFFKMPQSAERYNVQNIVRGVWGDESVAIDNHLKYEFYHDRFMVWHPNKFELLLQKDHLGGDLGWGSSFGPAMRDNSRRERIMQLLFDELVDYCAITEFTNVSNGFPCWHIMGWLRNFDRKTEMAKIERNVHV